MLSFVGSTKETRTVTPHATRHFLALRFWDMAPTCLRLPTSLARMAPWSLDTITIVKCTNERYLATDGLQPIPCRDSESRCQPYRTMSFQSRTSLRTGRVLHHRPKQTTRSRRQSCEYQVAVCLSVFVCP